MAEILHGPSPLGGGEFTVCGLSFDAHVSGDHDEPIVFAEKGETVTCPDCRRELDNLRGAYRRYKFVGCTARKAEPSDSSESQNL